MTPQTAYFPFPFMSRVFRRRPLLTAATVLCLGVVAAGAQQVADAAPSLAAVSAPSAFSMEAAAVSPFTAPLLPAASDSLPMTAAVSEGLPEAPRALQQKNLEASVPSSASGAPARVAPIYNKYIPAGWTAQPLTARDKVIVGARDLYSPLNFLAMIASAGYEQVLNGEPNYGVDRGAFGERLGAAGIRESTQGFLTDSVFSPLLHEDPRYYVEGPQKGFVHRTLYAVTRPLLTRTDSGKNTVNAALLLGYAGSAALSYSYYPQINKNFHDTASTYGGSLGGAALGFFVSEFSSQFLQAIHLEKRQ